MGRKPLRQDQKEVLLKMALAIIGKQGFYDLSFQMIANKAKLSQSAVMHYFPNRTTLISEISDYVAQDNIQFVAKENSPRDSALESIQKFINNNFRWAEENPDYAKAVVTFSSMAFDSEEFKTVYIQRLKAVREKLSGYLFAAIRERSVSIKESEVEEWAALIHNFVVSGITNYLATNDPKEKRNYLKRSEILLSLLRN